ncbi:hypothetical protein V202x_55380 [Gimesia aquarii]|uniref:Transmembrane protein n=2 Tax=Gimesia aquarii TaxID=2527964 RepID=A0A517X3Q3_9PLAN|nr:hypothetical protein V202x_55380 [Gimesia aquarii]
MVTEKSNTCSEPSDEVPAQSYEGIDWGLAIFLVLGVVALLLPHVSIPFVGVYWAAAVAVVVFVVWNTVMPTTCMSGGLICSLVAMAVIFNTLGIVLAVVIRLIVSFLLNHISALVNDRSNFTIWGPPEPCRCEF